LRQGIEAFCFSQVEAACAFSWLMTVLIDWTLHSLPEPGKGKVSELFDLAYRDKLQTLISKLHNICMNLLKFVTSKPGKTEQQSQTRCRFWFSS
jgi:hypothetical protein